MLVNIVRFPPIRQGKDDEFRAWFARSNDAYAAFEGLVSRRLLEPREGGNYVAIVEHESFETFMAMHTSPVQAGLRQEVEPLLDGDPNASFYEVVIG
jgi:antibiotic biosynthesis monooxygenase (ABM) superfamily enzyme